MSNWNTDAQFADDLSEDIIFINDRMKSFLYTNKVFIVVASKGMGKTLLLRYKRHLLANDPEGLVVIPENETADYVRLPASISRDKLHLMHNVLFWKDLWEISIAISALLHFPHSLSPNEKTHVENTIKKTPLPSEIQGQILAALNGKWARRYFPSDILIEILDQSAKVVEQIRSSCQQVIFHLFTKYISSGVCLFIDSFDQELSEQFPDDLDVWQAGQHGLMKAAWELSRHNNHVKVYVSVRQEAYSSYKGQDKNNMMGSTLLIGYSKDDLRGIFEKAIAHYENKKSVEDFVQINNVNNTYLRKKEGVFDYIYRHTLGIPRWLMILGEEISYIEDAQKSSRTWQKDFRTLVNDVASNRLAREYLESEMKLFFFDCTPEGYIKNFLSLINSSVLTLNNLKRIATKYGDKHHAGAIKHPFCILHNLGLLGVVSHDVNQKSSKQVFRKPYEFDWNIEGVLPIRKDGYYLIHPALHQIIHSQKEHYSYNKILIGDGLSWTKRDESQIRNSQIKIFLSYSHSNEAVADEIASSLECCFEEGGYIYDIWFDKWRIRAGQWVQEEVEKGLEESDYLLLLISSESMESTYVNAEWRTMFNRKLDENENSVIPVIVDETPIASLPTFLKNVFVFKLEDTADRGKVLKKLCEDIVYLKTQGNEL